METGVHVRPSVTWEHLLIHREVKCSIAGSAAEAGRGGKRQPWQIPAQTPCRPAVRKPGSSLPRGALSQHKGTASGQVWAQTCVTTESHEHDPPFAPSHFQTGLGPVSTHFYGCSLTAQCLLVSLMIVL